MAEIRATRDALVAQCGSDLARFGDLRRVDQDVWASKGHPLVSFEGQPPLELPPVDWEKIDALPENEIISEIRATRRALSAGGTSLLANEPTGLVLREDAPEK